ncbi:hypothetical protein V2J09_004335 [Rumex salicifolius]
MYTRALNTRPMPAHGRIDPDQSTGFVFFCCLLNGTDQYMELYFSEPKAHKNYLEAVEAFLKDSFLASSA